MLLRPIPVFPSAVPLSHAAIVLDLPPLPQLGGQSGVQNRCGQGYKKATRYATRTQMLKEPPLFRWHSPVMEQ